MSQAGILNNAVFPWGVAVRSLTGDTGGVVASDGSDNINILGSGSITVTGNPLTNTLTIAASGIGIQEIKDDTGTSSTPLANVWNLVGDTVMGDGFANITTTVMPATHGIYVSLAESIILPATTYGGSEHSAHGIIALGSTRVSDYFMHAKGTQNTFLGHQAGNLTLTVATSIKNVGLGTSSLHGLTSGTKNLAAGFEAAKVLGTGLACVYLGHQSGVAATTSSDCIGIGSESLSGITTSSAVVAIGSLAGSAYTTESSNICIENVGTIADANTIRIGTDGSGLGQHNKTYIAGTVTTARDITATTGNISSSAGSITAFTTLNAGTNITAANGSLYLGNFNGDTTASSILFQKSRAVPATTIVTGDALGQIKFTGYDGSNYQVGAEITSVSSGTIASGKVPGNLVFWTKPDSATVLSTRMTISPLGAITMAGADAGTTLTVTAGGLTVTAGTTTLTPIATATYSGLATVSTTGALGSLVNSHTDGQVLLAAAAGTIAWGTLGSTGSTIVYTPGTNALNLEVATASTTQRGGVVLATNAETRTGTDTGKAVTPDDLSYKLGTQTVHGLAIGGGASTSLGWMAAGTANQFVISGGASADPAWSTYTMPTTPVQGDMLYASSATVISQLAKDANATRYISNTGTNNNPAWAQIALSTGVSGQLPVANGGTGTNTLTIHGLLVGNTTSAINAMAAGTANQFVVSGGASADPTWSTYTMPTPLAQGDLLYASSSSAITNLAKDANATRYLSNTGTTNNPAWAQVALGTGVSGTLPIANGGTNSTSYTNYGVAYYNGTSLVNDANTTINPSGTLTSTTLRTGATTSYLSATGETISAAGSLSDVNINLNTKGIGNVNITTASTGYSNGQMVFRGIPTGGWSSSEWRTGQCVVQTTNATPTAILTIPLVNSLMVSVKIIINGFQDDYTDCVGGEILVTAYRAATGDIKLVGAPIINVNYTDTVDTSDIDASIDVGTQSLLLKVVGVASQNWNWVATYTYMYTISNA